MIKKVLYQNSSGFQAAFYTYKLPLCESIDASGVGADFISDSLAFGDGQITTYKKLKPRQIPADFALSIIDEKEAERKLNYMTKLFNPLDDGKLTIVNDIGTFEIYCSPAETPSFDNSKVSYVYRFSVDFICDYPYFKQLGSLGATIEVGTSTEIISNSVPDTPVQIFIPDCSNGATLVLNNRNGSAKIEILPYDKALTIDTQTFTAINANGIDVTKKIKVSSSIEDFVLTYGKNTLYLTGADSAVFSWNNLMIGVS